jgi:Zn-finger nucleic acid-binding protein
MRTPEAVAGMLCPVCKIGLQMSDRQGIEIDYCPQCRGIWLDRGELDKIIERSGAEAPQAPPPPQQPNYPPPPPQQPWPQQQQGGYRDDQRGYYHHKKRKSFFEELFD